MPADTVVGGATNQIFAAPEPCLYGPAPNFVRGDANQDGFTDVGDGIRVLGSLFDDEVPYTSCESAEDANDDGVIDISDPIYLLAFLFAGGAPPTAPWPDCGADETPDSLHLPFAFSLTDVTS